MISFAHIVAIVVFSVNVAHCEANDQSIDQVAAARHPGYAKMLASGSEAQNIAAGCRIEVRRELADHR